MIRKVMNEHFWMVFTDDDLDKIMVECLALMKFIGPRGKREILLTDLQDLLIQKDYIEFGPKHERLTTNQYSLES